MGNKNGSKAKADIPGGYVMLPRELLESPIWDKDPSYTRFWIYLLLKARWKEEPVTRGGVTIGRGQLLKSYRTIRKECRYRENQAWREWSLAKIFRMVSWFEAQGSIHTKRTDLGTLITLRNFNKYQDPDRYRRDLGTDLGTGLEQQEEGSKKELPERSITDSPSGSLPRSGHK